MCVRTHAHCRRLAVKLTLVEKTAELSVYPNLFRNVEGPRDLAAGSVRVCEFVAARVMLQGVRGLVQSACSPVAVTTYSLSVGSARTPAAPAKPVVLSVIASSPLVCAAPLGAFFFFFSDVAGAACVERGQLDAFDAAVRASCVHSSIADSRRVGLSNRGGEGGWCAIGRSPQIVYVWRVTGDE